LGETNGVRRSSGRSDRRQKFVDATTLSERGGGRKRRKMFFELPWSGRENRPAGGGWGKARGHPWLHVNQGCSDCKGAYGGICSLSIPRGKEEKYELKRKGKATAGWGSPSQQSPEIVSNTGI